MYRERVTIPYDVEHGYAPKFVSGNHYNYHELKYERAKRPKNGKVKTYKLADRERARATKDERRIARQLTRQAAWEAKHREATLRTLDRPKREAPKQAVPYQQTAAARLVYELVTE